MFLPGMFVGRIFDHGYLKIPIICAGTLLVVATLLVAECKEYWQFLLCQGFAVGVGATVAPCDVSLTRHQLACAVIFTLGLSIVSHWFKRKRGMALGFVSLGSSIGGTVLPIAVRQLIPQVGYALVDVHLSAKSWQC